MIKDVTLGQFFPGQSILHRMDPRMKIILTLLYITAVFTARSISAFILIVSVTFFLLLSSRIPVRTILRGMKPLAFIIVFTAVINIFWTKGETLLVDWYFIHIYAEGLLYALLMILRILCLLVGTCLLLTYTTSPIALTDGLERLLAPLKVLHIPVHEFSMMMTIALRFIPTLIEETDKIMSAQKSRGADFSSGSLIARARALLPIIIPLFISALRRAEELATAMECRCYRGGEGRTRMTERRLCTLDWVGFAAFCDMIAATLLLNTYLPLYHI